MKAFLLMLVIGPCFFAAARPHVPSDEATWKDRMGQIAGEYVKYGRVDGKYRWAPTDCMMPGGPPRMHYSQARDRAAHGQKLYTIFAKDVRWDQSRIPTYLPERLPADDKALQTSTPVVKRQPVAVGQVIVKEAWVPKAITREEFAKVAYQPLNEKTKSIEDPDRRKGGILDYGDQVRPYAVARDGAHWFRAEKKAGLFIMMKLDPKTAGTDEGWVYGTVADDLKTVTSVGKVASCMKCHQEAPHDRLFGYPIRGDGL